MRYLGLGLPHCYKPPRSLQLLVRAHQSRPKRDRGRCNQSIGRITRHEFGKAASELGYMIRHGLDTQLRQSACCGKPLLNRNAKL